MELPEWLKLQKEKSEKYQDLRGKVARLRIVSASELRNCWFSVPRHIKYIYKNQNRSIDKVQNLGNERR